MSYIKIDNLNKLNIFFILIRIDMRLKNSLHLALYSKYKKSFSEVYKSTEQYLRARYFKIKENSL